MLKQKESGVYDLRPDIRAKERFVNFTAFVHQAVLNQSVHLIGYTRQLQRPCLTIKQNVSECIPSVVEFRNLRK